MKIIEFWIKFHWNFVPKGSIYNIPALFSDNGMAPNRRQVIIWTNADLIHWRIYAALGGDELKLRHIVHLIYELHVD